MRVETQTKNGSYQNIESLLGIIEKVNGIYQKGNAKDLEQAGPLLEYLNSGLKAMNIWVHLRPQS